MTEFDEASIRGLFEEYHQVAIVALTGLDFCCSEKPSFQGLRGWVFEQTVQNCLRKELKALRILAEIKEQASLAGRARVDLLIGSTVALEIKAKGLFDSGAASRYLKYRLDAEKLGYTYLYLTLEESYLPYRKAMIEAVGEENAFFLDTHGDWGRLIKRITKLLELC